MKNIINKNLKNYLRFCLLVLIFGFSFFGITKFADANGVSGVNCSVMPGSSCTATVNGNTSGTASGWVGVLWCSHTGTFCSSDFSAGTTSFSQPITLNSGQSSTVSLIIHDVPWTCTTCETYTTTISASAPPAPTGSLSGSNCTLSGASTTCSTSVSYSVTNNGWSVYLWNDRGYGPTCINDGSAPSPSTFNLDTTNTNFELLYYPSDTTQNCSPSGTATQIGSMLTLKANPAAATAPTPTLSITPTDFMISPSFLSVTGAQANSAIGWNNGHTTDPRDTTAPAFNGYFSSGSTTDSSGNHSWSCPGCMTGLSTGYWAQKAMVPYPGGAESATSYFRVWPTAIRFDGHIDYRSSVAQYWFGDSTWTMNALGTQSGENDIGKSYGTTIYDNPSGTFHVQLHETLLPNYFKCVGSVVNGSNTSQCGNIDVSSIIGVPSSIDYRYKSTRITVKSTLNGSPSSTLPQTYVLQATNSAGGPNPQSFSSTPQNFDSFQSFTGSSDGVTYTITPSGTAPAGSPVLSSITREEYTGGISSDTLASSQNFPNGTGASGILRKGDEIIFTLNFVNVSALSAQWTDNASTTITKTVTPGTSITIPFRYFNSGGTGSTVNVTGCVPTLPLPAGTTIAPGDLVCSPAILTAP